MGEWYFEYEIQVNRPGLLGDIASLLGMLKVNIVTINGVDEGRRGLLLKAENEESIKRFQSIVNTIDDIRVTKFREPKLRDRLAVRHGQYIEKDADEKIHSVLYGMNWAYWSTLWLNCSKPMDIS